MAEVEPDRAELFDLYRIRLDEYRFQVNLNWSRTQYFLVLNVGIITIATGLIKTSLLVSGFLFGVGAVAATMCGFGAYGQHQYYRAARAGKTQIEGALQLGGLAIHSTPGMRKEAGVAKPASRWHRIREEAGTVTNITYAVLALLAVADVAGLVLVLTK
jgi:hypothetical protein